MRHDAGTYAWLERGRTGGLLALHGGKGTRLLRVTRAEGLPARAARAVCEALAEIKMSSDDAGQLIHDGATARRLAVERLCGLGRELDGTAFDESIWRKTLRALTLPEIHGQLRTFELRFDQKYPPAPTSRPETLSNNGEGGRQGAALACNLSATCGDASGPRRDPGYSHRPASERVSGKVIAVRREG